MNLAPRALRPATHHRSDWKRPVSGVAVSALVHLLFFVLAALICFTPKPMNSVEAVDSSWSAPDAPVLDISLPTEPVPSATPPGDSASPGGSSLAELIDLARIASSDELPLTDELVPNLNHLATARLRVSMKAEKKSVVETSGSLKSGSGQGRGTGNGIGDGKGFFGSEPGVKRIVFVVDNSRSMNAKHDSAAKTRFRRLKVELIKAILELPPESQFFVIFFSDVMTPMPAETLQPASPQAKDNHLRWLAQVNTGGGPTDPRNAMFTALRFQPDLIYFLTDGEFAKGYSLKLRSIRQTRTAIHTFAFGETLAEETLREIAENNGGEYKFVP